MLLEASPLGLDVTPQARRGEHGEREHQRGRLAADEQDAPRGGTAAVAGVEHGLHRRVDAERVVAQLERALAARDPGQDVVDVPHVQRPRVQGHRPRVAAEERRERGQRGQRRDARRRDDGHRRLARLVDEHVAERQGRGQRAPPHDAHVDPDRVEP